MKQYLNTLSTFWQNGHQKLQNFLSSKVFEAMFWVLLGNGGYQFLRLISNLILSRLLFPEAFGIMAIVTAIMVGLEQISDVGLREGVVNSSRIEDPKFMRTAWTLQLLRSGVIALLTLALAAPVASFYDEPLLFPVLAATAITMFTAGFNSIALLAYDKRLELKTQVKCNLTTQIISLLVIITWASIWPNIWALVAGGFVSAVLEVYLSYKLFKGHFSKLAWDKETVHGLFHFGKWIIISSAISYITLQGDKLIMGSFLTMGDLGKYSIAATWAAMVTLISYEFSRRVLHPYFKQSIDKQAGFGAIRNMRLLLNSGYLVVCIGLAIFGDYLIEFLYDDRYQEAGWMLQILALGQIGRAMSGTLTPFLLAKGDSFSQMNASAISAVFLVVFVITGGTLFGSVGVIIGYTLIGLFIHPVMIYLAIRHGYNCAFEDLALIIFSIVIVITGWILVDASILDILVNLERTG